MIQCKDCERFLPEDMYYRGGNGYLWTKCKDCTKIQRQSAHEADPEKRKQINRRARLKSYGLTEEDFESMVEAQGNSCAICSTKFRETPHIDHCHRTGIVRGLLCTKCNTALGLLGDDVYHFYCAIGYLYRTGDHGSPHLPSRSYARGFAGDDDRGRLHS